MNIILAENGVYAMHRKTQTSNATNIILCNRLLCKIFAKQSNFLQKVWLLGLWHAHNKIPVPCKTKQNFQTLLSMAVHCGEPKSGHTGRFVAPSYRIMAENPAISAEIGHGGEPKNCHRYPPNLTTLLPKNLFSTKMGLKKEKEKGRKRQTFYSVILYPSNKSDIHPKYFSSLRF